MEHEIKDELIPWTMEYRVRIQGDNFFRHSEVRKAKSFGEASREAHLVLTKCENARITGEGLRIVAVEELKKGES